MISSFLLADLLGFVVLILLGLSAGLVLRSGFAIGVGRCVFLYIWHTVFCFVYFSYVKSNGGDAIGYYILASESDIEFGVGTAAIVWFTRIFADNLGFSIEVTFLVYNIIGFVGLLAFDASLKQAVTGSGRNIQRMVGVLAFFPSISFWSSAIGKDAISFTAVTLALWASIALERRWLLMGFSIVMMLVVRPHIAALMVIALAFSVVFQKELPVAKKAILAAFLVVAIGVAVPFALTYAGLGDAAGSGDFSDYVETRQGYNQEGGGGVDISQMSLPLQLFTYIFRPLFFDAGGIPGLAASFENTILMVFAYYSFVSWLRLRRTRDVNLGNVSFLLLYAVMTWLILAMTTANLGISLRQKWMFMPMLLYVAVAVVAATNRGHKLNRRWHH